MAVEATHLNLFRPQLMRNRDLPNPINQGNAGSAYVSQQMRFLGIPSAVASPEIYQPSVCESAQAKTSVNTDSGLTYNISAPRKRSRVCFNQLHAAPNFPAVQKVSNLSPLPSFVGDDISSQIQQYEFEIDALVHQHTKKIRMEIEERQNQQTRLIAAAIGEGVMKKLKEKEEQIQRMGKLNLVLQERVKSLYVENQLWRDLAQTNEATANSLRTNLEQVLQHVGGEERVYAGEEEDVESCCGSSDHGRDAAAQDGDDGSRRCSDRKCKICGEREACVLLLPCRHLCLCGVCGSGSQQLQACPVCNSSMDATLHVNMS